MEKRQIHEKGQAYFLFEFLGRGDIFLYHCPRQYFYDLCACDFQKTSNRSVYFTTYTILYLFYYLVNSFFFSLG